MEPVSLEEFVPILKQEIKDIQDEEHFSEESDALAFWYGTHVLNLSEQDARNACQFRGPGGRGIDFLYVDTSKKRIVIAQAEASRDFDPQCGFGASSIRKLRSALSALTNPDSIKEGDPILGAVEVYTEYRRRDYPVNLLALISGRPTFGLENEADSFSRELERKYPKHDFEVVDCGRLIEEYCKAIERIAPPDISFSVHPEIMKYADSTIVVSIPGSEVSRNVKTYGLSLFERNARLPLLRSKINLEIVGQLESNDSQEKFWYLNNGLTMVCRSFDVRKQPIKLYGAQIVNGCQTAWTLSKHPRKLERVYVLAKIIRTEDDKFAYKIRRATNLQNEITSRDLHSGDFTQLRLQRAFEKEGYYYERKKDEWAVWKKNLPQIRDRYPNENIDNEKLARLFLAWIGKPSEAKEKKREIFIQKGGFYDQIFEDMRTAHELLLPWLIREYLYQRFDVGYRRKGARKTMRHYVRTVGDLTVLALIGKTLNKKYGLSAKSTSSRRKMRLLVERLENPHNYKDFFRKYNKVVSSVLRGLETYGNKLKRQSTIRKEAWDERELHRVYSDMLKDGRIRTIIRQAVGVLPPL